jgi:hypothetical protein
MGARCTVRRYRYGRGTPVGAVRAGTRAATPHAVVSRRRKPRRQPDGPSPGDESGSGTVLATGAGGKIPNFRSVPDVLPMPSRPASDRVVPPGLQTSYPNSAMPGGTHVRRTVPGLAVLRRFRQKGSENTIFVNSGRDKSAYGSHFASTHVPMSWAARHGMDRPERDHLCCGHPRGRLRMMQMKRPPGSAPPWPDGLSPMRTEPMGSGPRLQSERPVRSPLHQPQPRQFQFHQSRS